MFLDVTDMVDFNIDLLNRNDLPNSFFHLSKSDPTAGFLFDAGRIFGPTYPPSSNDAFPSWASPAEPTAPGSDLYLRLLLGSHLAKYLRHELEEQRGYTATVGIATSKLLSKLVGNVNKPKNQTTLTPPYQSDSAIESNVIQFLDAHDIGRIPGIGFKLSQKIRTRVLGREPKFRDGLVYGPTRENVTVRDVRLFPGMGPELLEEILSGPGSHKGIGGTLWGLIHGVDGTEVAKAKNVPSQISIEDSYTRLDTFHEVKEQLITLAVSLIRRMRIDLTEEDEDEGVAAGKDTAYGENLTEDVSVGQSSSFDRATPTVGEESKTRPAPSRWLAHPRTLRLSTRPRRPQNPDGTRPRGFNRISRSCPLPSFVFNLNENVHVLAEKLVLETLVPSFRKLHPEKVGWNLSLVNLAVTNMMEAATESKDSEGRDIGKMFRKQESVLKAWKVEDKDMPPSDGEGESTREEKESTLLGDLAFDAAKTTGVHNGSFQNLERTTTGQPHEAAPLDYAAFEGDGPGDGWSDDDDESAASYRCPTCGAIMPAFAASAHRRFHEFPD